MRFVFFGLSLTSSWGNGHATTYRGLLEGLRQLGHTSEFFERDVEWYARHRDLPRPQQARLWLYSDWSSIRPTALNAARAADAIVVGSYYPDAVRVLDELLHLGLRVCFYDIDTPVTLEQLRARQCAYLHTDQIPALSLYLSFTGGPTLNELRNAWGARMVRPLYCACDERKYRSARRLAHPHVALSFMGTFAPDRQAKFERLLLKPARQLPHLRFHVAGSMYPDATAWPRNIHFDSHLPPDQHPSFYAASRFTLNLTRQVMVEAGYSPSIRLFEAAAAATPIITDPWPGLEEFFRPGKDLVVAAESENLIAALMEMSCSDAAALGRSAQDRVFAQHTCRHRARELESFLEECCAPKPLPAPSQSKLVT
ncbi:MAG TPA: glycosyltransferase [Terriglobales bacterium]|nr:glycosyltransferase [Terriglobales bacterium]